MAATELLAAAAHPGYAATNLQTGQGNVVLEALMKVGNAVFAQSDAQGAWPPTYAATMPDVAPGSFWGPGGMGGTRGHPVAQQPSRRAVSDADAARLWTVSEELTGVSYDALAAPRPA